MKTQFTILILFVFFGIAHAETIIVPDDYSKIQLAINAAENGDVILVRPGSYVGIINFSGKAITVRSDKDGLVDTKDIAPEETIIDGNQYAATVAFASSESDTSVLKGFTIKNGIGFNSGTERLGGGIFCYNTTPVIANNIIKGNQADVGGGIYCFGTDGNAYITENTITRNDAYKTGGAIATFEASPYITHNTIDSNSAEYDGGGIYIYQFGTPVIFNNIIKHNEAESGGGIMCYSSFGNISNNIFRRNLAEQGGGIFLYASSPKFTNNTLYINEAAVEGGSFYCFWYSFPVITNCILWNNGAPTGNEIDIDGTSAPIVTYSDVKGGYAGDGNIDADPEFLYTGPNLKANLHLSPTSPCIDTGDNRAEAIGPSDFNHEPRIENGVIDMGVDEYYAYPLDELHVPSQYITIQDAIDAAPTGATVYVAPRFHNEGPYHECIDFKGKAITVQSDWDANPDTFDIAPADTIIEGGYSGSVVTFASGEGPDSVLRGFTLTRGTGTLSYGRRNGGGIYCSNASPTISKNIIKQNQADSGAGIYCEIGSPALFRNTIEWNEAVFEGGGISLFACPSASIDANIIRHNQGASWGGGIEMFGYSEPWITNNVFHDNEAGQGGALHCRMGRPVLRHNTIFANDATSSGGALYISNQSEARVNNCIIWKNTSPPGTEVTVEVESHLTLDYSNITDGADSIYCSPDSTFTYGGYENYNMLAEDPLFTDEANHIFTLLPESPCINRGTVAKSSDHDIKGNSRPDTGLPEMGAYEYTGFLPFTADIYTISIAENSERNFDFDAGIENASRKFHVFGSASGTAPGYPLQGNALLPLNIHNDGLFGMVMTMPMLFPNFINNKLDASGKGTVQMKMFAHVLPPEAVGYALCFAAVLAAPIDYASNAIGIEVIP